MAVGTRVRVNPTFNKNRLRGQQPGLPPPPRRSPPAPGQLLMVELRGTTTLGSPFHRRLHYDSFSPDYLSQPIAMVDQGQHDADMPTAMAFYTWAVTSRSIVRRSLAAPSSFFFGCFDRHAHTPAALPLAALWWLSAVAMYLQWVLMAYGS